MTVASTLAAPLGLSMHQQRIGFAIGVGLILVGLASFIHQRWRHPVTDKGQDEQPTVHGDRNIINPSGGTNVTGDGHISAAMIDRGALALIRADALEPYDRTDGRWRPSVLAEAVIRAALSLPPGDPAHAERTGLATFEVSSEPKSP